MVITYICCYWLGPTTFLLPRGPHSSKPDLEIPVFQLIAVQKSKPFSQDVYRMCGRYNSKEHSIQGGSCFGQKIKVWARLIYVGPVAVKMILTGL
jgi:hypothetical protein